MFLCYKNFTSHHKTGIGDTLTTPGKRVQKEYISTWKTIKRNKCVENYVNIFVRRGCTAGCSEVCRKLYKYICTQVMHYWIFQSE